MANQISIILGGDAAPLVRASQEAGTALTGIQQAATQTQRSITQLTPTLERAATGLTRLRNGLRDAAGGPSGGNSLSNSINQTNNSLRNLQPGANSAALALQNVGRVAQDVPFGFIGIQNNLNPLLESFQRLRASTGSNSAAFRALGSSLIGAGGIGLALSVVSSAILIFQNGLGGFNKKTKEAKESTDELAKSIRSISSIQGEAVAGVQGQIAQVQALAGAITDSNRSYAERKRALEELKEADKAHFGDLTLQSATYPELTRRVKEYTAALVNEAITKKFINEIADVAKAISDSDEAVVKSTAKVTQAREDAVKKQLDAARRQQEASKAGNFGQAVTNPEVLTAVEAVTDAENELAIANERITKLIEQKIKLEQRVNTAVLEGLKFKKTGNVSEEKEVDLLKRRLEALEKIKDVTTDVDALVNLEEQIFDLKVKITLRDAAKNGLSKEEISFAIAGFQKQLNEAFKNQALGNEAIIKVKPTFVLAADIPTEIQSAVAKATGFDKKIPEITIKDVRIRFLGVKVALEIEEAEKAGAALRDTILNSLTQGIGDSAVNIGELFGNIFSGQGIGASLQQAAQGFLGIIGSVLQEVGRQMIATSTAVAALKKALSTLFANPVAGLAAGIGLVALGGLLKTIKFDVPKLAEGGIATRATLGIFGEAGPEAILPLSKVNDFVGGGNISLQPSIRFSGTDFQIMLERTNEKRRRLG